MGDSLTYSIKSIEEFCGTRYKDEFFYSHSLIRARRIAMQSNGLVADTELNDVFDTKDTFLKFTAASISEDFRIWRNQI